MLAVALRPVVIPLTIVASVAGCVSVTTPLSYAEARDVPSEQQVRFQQGLPDSPTIMIRRDRGFVGSACRTDIFLDGVLAGNLWAGERIALATDPGEHIIGVQAAGICAAVMKEQAVLLNPKQIIHYRVSGDMQSGSNLYRTTP